MTSLGSQAMKAPVPAGSDNYNHQTEVKDRPPVSGGYARTLCEEKERRTPTRTQVAGNEL